MKKYIVILSVIVAGCSDNPIVVEHEIMPAEANTAQVLYPGMIQSGYVPTLAEVMTTNQDAHWICSFNTIDGTYWQTAFYVYPDGTGETFFNGINNAFPQSFQFNWSGDQKFHIESPNISLTLYNMRFTTDPDSITPNAYGSKYEFFAESSDGGVALCTKIEGAARDYL